MPRGDPRLRTSDGKMNAIGVRVADRRSTLQMTQDVLCARTADLTGGAWAPAWQDISRIENGARIVTDTEVLALSSALQCSPCWLLTGDRL